MANKITFNEKILIAGSRGMVGRATYKKLINKGYGNHLLDGKIFTPSKKELDLSNFNDVKDWFELNKPTVVILAAAKVGGILANNQMPSDFILENLKIQTNLIEIAFRNKVKRFLFLGSSCIYPKFAKQPIKEEYLLTSQLEETNQWYAIAKIAGLKLCEALRIQHGFDTISLMPTNLYGPNDNYDENNSHVMPALIRKFNNAVKQNFDIVTCWGDGSPLREFLHVEDLAEAVVFILENWQPNIDKNNQIKEPYHLNVGSDEEISIFDLAHKIAELSGYEGEINWDLSKPNGTPRKKIDCTRINKLGWKPKIRLEEGIKKTIEDYREIYK